MNTQKPRYEPPPTPHPAQAVETAYQEGVARLDAAQARIEELEAQLRACLDVNALSIGNTNLAIARIASLEAEVGRRRADVETIVNEVNKYKGDTRRTTLDAAAQRIALGIAEALQAQWKEESDQPREK